MTMNAITTLPRVFEYNSMALEDPDPAKSPEEVKDIYAEIYHELTQAKISGPKITEDAMVYEFDTSFGTKGITVTEIAAGRMPAGMPTKPLDEDNVFELMELLNKAVHSERHGNPEDSGHPILPPSSLQGMV
jgi:PRTRC genetic system protein C